MQVNHGFDVNHIHLQAVNNCVRKTVKVEFSIGLVDFGPAFRLGHDAAQRSFELIEKIISKALLPFLIPKAAASSSSSASGWLTTRIELFANVLDDLLHWAASDFAFLDLARPALNDFVPLCFAVCVHGIIQAGN